jgi:cytochrome c-type biogenesis protein
VVLPLVYGLVIVFGVMMLTDRNPFARLQTVQSPMLHNPFVTAYVYGLLFGPMALPCIGPFLTAAFALGATGAGNLGSSMTYFLGFGAGFGWPLVVLPLIALPAQRRLVGWLTRNHQLLNRVSGVLLIAIGIFGTLTELVPQWDSGFEIAPGVWWVYWAAAALLMAAIGLYTYRRNPPGDSSPARSTSS